MRFDSLEKTFNIGSFELRFDSSERSRLKRAECVMFRFDSLENTGNYGIEENEIPTKFPMSANSWY